MTDSLIGNNNNQDPVIDPNKDYYEELVGEGKKFKDNSALARGKMEADVTVAHRNRQLDELRQDYLRLQEELKAGPNIRELIDQLKTQNISSSRNDNNDSNDDNDRTPSFDPKQIDSLVSSKIQEYELTKRQTENFNTVRAKLQEQFGSNYERILQERMNTLGLDAQDIDILAKKSPKAFFNTLGLEENQRQDGFQSPITSQRRNDNFSPNVPKRTWSYYEKLRKEKPEVYHDVKTQVQMQKDAIELGAAFQDGNWANPTRIL